MKLSINFFDIIRDKVAVSSVVGKKVTLTKKGMEYGGLCPFHNEKTPSFTVNDIKRFYHCFGCAAHGDVIKFLSETSGLSYKEAAVKLAEENGIEIPKLTKEEEKAFEEIDQIQNVLSLAGQFFKSNLNDKVINYLKSRDINKEVIDRFDIGYAPNDRTLIPYLEKHKIPLMMLSRAGLISKNTEGKAYEVFRDRLIFPIKNIYGKIIGFGGRAMADVMPKYLNSPETIVFKKNETLYGENTAISAAYKKNQMIVVEGYVDTIALQKHGFENCVASLGTAVTANHINKLWRSVDEIIMCLDGDEAGIRAMKKVIDLVLPQINYSKKISFIILPQSMDPDEILQKKGKDFFAQILNKRSSLSEMIWYLETKGGIGKNPEAKANLEHRLKNISEVITDKIISSHYLRFFKNQMWNFFHSGKKTHSNVDISLPTNLSDMELVEHSIISLLIKAPALLQYSDVQETLSRLVFKNNELLSFSNYLLAINEPLTFESLQGLLEKTSFSKLFMLLSKPDVIFLNISQIFLENNSKLLWEILIKKFNLLKSKIEYTLLVSKMDNDSHEKAQIYAKEIIQTQKDIDKMNEILIENSE